MQLRDVRVGQAKIEKIPIMAMNPEGIEFGEVQSNLEGMTGKIIEQSGNSTAPYLLELTFISSKIGTTKGEIKIPTNHPRVKELKLRVSARSEGEISLSPKRVNIKKIKKDQDYTVTLHSDKKKFKVIKVEDPKDKVIIKTEEKKPGLDYLITLTLSEQTKNENRSFSTKLVITTDNSEQPTIEVPVRYNAALGQKNLKNNKKKKEPIKMNMVPNNQ